MPLSEGDRFIVGQEKDGKVNPLFVEKAESESDRFILAQCVDKPVALNVVKMDSTEDQGVAAVCTDKLVGVKTSVQYRYIFGIYATVFPDEVEDDPETPGDENDYGFNIKSDSYYPTESYTIFSAGNYTIPFAIMDPETWQGDPPPHPDQHWQENTTYLRHQYKAYLNNEMISQYEHIDGKPESNFVYVILEVALDSDYSNISESIVFTSQKRLTSSSHFKMVFDVCEIQPGGGITGKAFLARQQYNRSTGEWESGIDGSFYPFVVLMQTDVNISTTGEKEIEFNAP